MAGGSEVDNIFLNYLVDYDSVIYTHMWMNVASVGLDP
jgi:hypothetical protein